MSSPEKMFEVQKDKYERSKAVLTRRHLLFENLWLTATKIKKQFKDMSLMKQEQVIFMVRSIILLLRECRTSEEIVRNKTSASKEINKKLRKRQNVSKKPQRLSAEVQIQSTLNGQLKNQGSSDSLSGIPANSQEKITSADSLVDSKINVKTEPDEIEIIDVSWPTNEIEIDSGSHSNAMVSDAKTSVNCHICGKLFSKNAYWNRHMRLVHKINSKGETIPDKILTCILCDKPFKQKKQLQVHINSAHLSHDEYSKKNNCNGSYNTPCRSNLEKHVNKVLDNKDASPSQLSCKKYSKKQERKFVATKPERCSTLINYQHDHLTMSAQSSPSSTILLVVPALSNSKPDSDQSSIGNFLSSFSEQEFPADQTVFASQSSIHKKSSSSHPGFPDLTNDTDDDSENPLSDKVKIVPSDRGNTYVIDDYIFHLSRSQKNGVLYLKCSNEKCTSRAKCLRHREPTYSEHNHPPNEVDLQVLYMKAELKRQAVLDPRSPRDIFDEVCQQYPRAATKVTFNSVRSTLYRHLRMVS